MTDYFMHIKPERIPFAYKYYHMYGKYDSKVKRL